jgi:hypothetical protein
MLRKRPLKLCRRSHGETTWHERPLDANDRLGRSENAETRGILPIAHHMGTARGSRNEGPGLQARSRYLA